MEKPSARGPSPGRKAIHVLGSRLNRKPKRPPPVPVKRKAPEFGSHGSSLEWEICTTIYQLSPPRSGRDCQTAPSTSSSSLRSCGFFVKCQKTRCENLQKAMAGASYAGWVAGKSNFTMMPACARRCNAFSFAATIVPRLAPIARGLPVERSRSCADTRSSARSDRNNELQQTLPGRGGWSAFHSWK